MEQSVRCSSCFLNDITALLVSKAPIYLFIHSISFEHLLCARNCLDIGDFPLNKKSLNGQFLFNEYRVLLLQDKRVLEIGYATI